MGRWEEDGRRWWKWCCEGEKEVLLAGLAAFGWPLVLGVNVGRRASHATHRHRRSVGEDGRREDHKEPIKLLAILKESN